VTSTVSTTTVIRDTLASGGFDLVITVPCKYFASLLVEMDGDERFEIVYPCREEEGLGIAAGAHLGGRKPIMIIQNSGLGNMVNAYCSLNQYYGIPLCLIISHRGDELEHVPAQVPMGTITQDLLSMLGIECVVLEHPDDVGALEVGLARFGQGQSVAFLSKKTFWGQ